MLKFFKHLLFSSLARQLIFGIAAVHAVLMTIFVFDLVERQREFMLNQSNLQAIGLATTLATNGSSWVLANDLVGIEEIISSQSHYPDLKYAMFIDLQGKVLGYSDRDKTGQYIGDKISQKILYGAQTTKIIHESNSIIDVAAPITVNSKIIGWARVGISRLSMSNNLNLVTKDGLLYTIIAILVGVLFAWLMARGLTTGIRKLKHAIDQISAGSRDITCELNRHDELEDLSQDFNKMLITLKEHENKIIKTHEALNLSERKVSNLIDNLRTEYVFYSHNTDGTFTYISPSITDVLGYSVKEYLNQYDTFYTDSPINIKATELTNRVINGQPIPRYEAEVYHKDGRKILMEVTESAVFNSDGIVTSIEGLARNITEIRQADEKIKQEKDNFEREQLLLKSIIDAIPDKIYFKNNKGVYLGSNRAFNEDIGLSPEDMFNKTDIELFPHEKVLSNRIIEEQINLTGHDVHNEETISNIGGIRKVSDTVYTCFKKDNGDLLGYIQISRDISDIKNQEVQLRRSQRLDALGKLTGGIAHDYNNLLGVVIGYAELLSMSLQDEKLKVFSDEIMKAGKRGANLTKKLLAFTKSQSPTAASVNINDLLKADLNMLQKTLTAKVEIKYNLDSSLWDVWIDKSDFQDCILNMSINAMHAMPDGGELIIETINTSLSPAEAKVKQITPGEYVRISITDTGCGMNETVKDQLFDPFFTTKGDMGSGLGLSQVFGFINRSQGHINIQSQPGEGSTFNLYFKRYIADDNENTSNHDSSVVLPGNNQTILVVDDEPALKELASHMLSKNGYKVFEANGVEQALAHLEKESIDLVLTDIIMPDVDGYELATIVKDKYPDVKIMLASGFSRPEFQNPEHQDLTDNLLHKPYTSTELMDAVTNKLKNNKVE